MLIHAEVFGEGAQGLNSVNCSLKLEGASVINKYLLGYLGTQEGRCPSAFENIHTAQQYYIMEDGERHPPNTSHGFNVFRDNDHEVAVYQSLQRNNLGVTYPDLALEATYDKQTHRFNVVFSA